MKRVFQASLSDPQADEHGLVDPKGNGRPSSRGKDRQERNLGWLVLACALITLIVCVFSWVATFGLLPERALASGESLLAADYRPWEGYRVLNLDVANLATAAAYGDAPWQGQGTPVVVATLPPVTPFEITSQATPLPTLTPVQVTPTRRPVLPRATNTLPPTIPGVTSTSTTAPTVPPPPSPAPTSPPPVPTATATIMPTPSDTPTPDTPTATATPDTPTPTMTLTSTPIPVNLALGKAVTASSIENDDLLNFAASYAVDGNAGTRWSSYFADPQWIAVDLGSIMSFSSVELSWEAAYGSSYQIETSDDGIAWSTIYSTTTGDGGIDTIGIGGSGRYVRMYGTVRGTAWGYSLWEFSIYG